MKTIGLAVAMAWLCTACSSGKTGGSSDAGPRGNVIDEELQIAVSGTAEVLPLARTWMTNAGLTVPSLEGLTLRIEEPLRVAVGDSKGIFHELTLDSSATYAVTGVPVDSVNLGVAAGILDPTDEGRVTRAATILYDVAVEGQKPSADLEGTRAFAIPRAFHEKLSEAVTPASIRAITGNQHESIATAGFILGLIVNASGEPMPGATITPSDNKFAARIFYPTADLASTQTSTSSNGLFLYVHNGGDVDTFRFTVEGKPEYVERNAGAVKNAGVVMTVYPGRVAP